MKSQGSHQMTRWQRDRRAFIDHRIYWHGSIGLAHLMDVMEISRVQASKYLNGYISDHPDHLHYDKRTRTYVMGHAYEVYYLSIAPAEYLAILRVTPTASLLWQGFKPPGHQSGQYRRNPGKFA